MIIYIGELVGTAMYILMGLSINYIAYTKSNKNQLGTLIFVSFGWAIAYFIPSIAFGDVSGPYLNPALVMSAVSIRLFEERFMWGYVIVEVVGAIVGVLLFYGINYEKLNNISVEEQKADIFFTTPKSKNIVFSIISEFVATFFIAFGIFSIGQVYGIKVEIVYLYVILIMALIGIIFDYNSVSTNPLRDIIPRLFYVILPMGRKSKINLKDFIYSVITIFVPILAAYSAAFFYKILPWSSAMAHE